LDDKFKLGAIVRHKQTNQMYEVISQLGYVVHCKSINPPYDSSAFLAKDLEVIMEEGSNTEAFNILFKPEDS
jgi:hypothetical protein